MADTDRGGCLDSRGRMSRRKLRATPALRAYIKRFAPKPAAPKAPPVDNPYHRFFTHNRSLEELARPNINEKQ